MKQTNSTYLTLPKNTTYAATLKTYTAYSTALPQRGRNVLLSFTIILLAIAAILVPSAATIAGNNYNQSNTVKADDSGKTFDPVRFAMCFFGKNSITGKAYQWTTTDSLAFALRSKSSITNGRADVSTGLNWMLETDDETFAKTNYTIDGWAISGYNPKTTTGNTSNTGSANNNTTTTTPNSAQKDPTPKFNGGAQVNPYDRFGLAGLNFSAYAGEWKYVLVEACSDSPKADSSETGKYYTDRMIPQTTWEGINTSRDVRTEQLKKGSISLTLIAFFNTIANVIFFLSKVMVAVTISLINLAFSDLVKTLGIQNILTGDNSGSSASGGLFGALFNNLFYPLIALAFIATGLNILWLGLAKRQFRTATSTIVRSLIMFFVAIFISLNAATAVALPNNIAIGWEAIMVGTIANGSVTQGNGLCTTDIANSKTTNASGQQLYTDTGKDASDLEKIGTNMRSTIDCSLWQEFLFKPWTQGQFGSDWNQLWAKGKTPSWADKSTSAELVTSTPNAMKIAGDAAVPMGGGKFINNWALFQISTQTNVHSPIGSDGQMGAVTSGVSNDWWRIVDILSGYDEIDLKAPNATNKDAQEGTASTSKAPDPAGTPLKQWNTWIGNTGFSRIAIALSNVVVTAVGVAAPLAFAFASAIYAIGTAILMIFAPVMLLFACWSDKGWETFKSWAELLINNVLKRIVAGTMLVLSFLFTSTCIKMMQTTSWWQGITLMMLASYVLIKSRHQIYDAFASVKFAATDFAQTQKKLIQGGKTLTKAAGSGAAMGAVGGASAKAHGGSFTKGASRGARREILNVARKSSGGSQLMKEAARAYNKHDLEKNGRDALNANDAELCANCEGPLNISETVGVNQDGGMLCYKCLDESNDPTVREEKIDWNNWNEQGRQQLQQIRSGNQQMKRVHVDSIADDTSAQHKIEKMGRNDISDTAKVKILAEVAALVNKDIGRHEKSLQKSPESNKVHIPNPPSYIANYLDHEQLEDAWEKKDYLFIREAYTLAWTAWSQETMGITHETASEEILKKLRENMDENPDDNDDEEKE